MAIDLAVPCSNSCPLHLKLMAVDQFVIKNPNLDRGSRFVASSTNLIIRDTTSILDKVVYLSPSRLFVSCSFL